MKIDINKEMQSLTREQVITFIIPFIPMIVMFVLF